ncbi:MAG: J domain-containing protein [Eubacteriales bacterium]|nr:J domain-containing protein [Eubacteriales bacterium]
MQTAFERLGLRPDADEAAIRNAYRRLVKTCHPDSFSDPEEQKAGQKELISINLAYAQCLKTVESRHTPSPALPVAQAKYWAKSLLERKQYGMALFQLGRSEDKDAEWHALQGEALMGLKDYLGAHQAWRAAVRAEPDNLSYRREALAAEMALKRSRTLHGRLAGRARSLFAKGDD